MQSLLAPDMVIRVYCEAWTVKVVGQHQTEMFLANIGVCLVYCSVRKGSGRNDFQGRGFCSGRPLDLGMLFLVLIPCRSRIEVLWSEYATRRIDSQNNF